MVIVDGQGQGAEVLSHVPVPIVVLVQDPDDNPIPDKIVTFRVTRSDGMANLSTKPGKPAPLPTSTRLAASPISRVKKGARVSESK